MFSNNFIQITKEFIYMYFRKAVHFDFELYYAAILIVIYRTNSYFELITNIYASVD